MSNNPLPFKINAKKEAEQPICDLKLIKEYVDEYRKLHLEMQEKETAFDEAKKRFNNHRQEVIPKYLDQFSLSQIEVEGGDKITIKRDVSVSVKDEEKLFNWLIERKEDAIITDNITLKKVPQKIVDKLLFILGKENLDYTYSRKIVSQTLQAYVRNILGTKLTEEEKIGALKKDQIIEDDKLKDFINIYPYSVATVKSKKKLDLPTE